MAKLTRAQLAQRKRVAFYKKIIVYGFLAMTVLPIFSSMFLFYKLNQLEQKLEYALSEEGRDYLTYQSSSEALEQNPNATSGVFAEAATIPMNNTSINTDSILNTEERSSIDSSESVVEEETQQPTTEGETVQNVTEEQTGAIANGKKVYLTFDDGPSIYTGQILDILAANNVKATFFVIGRDEEYYEYYKRIVEEGHTIGMHSYSHVYSKLYQSVDSFADEVVKLQTLLKDVTGVECNLFRFPGGSSNRVAALPIEEYIDYLNENDITYYDWNALSGDATSQNYSPEQLVANIMDDVAANEDSIVLMHDLQNQHATVESLQLLIDTLKAEGYEILPIDENAPLIQHAANEIEK